MKNWWVSWIAKRVNFEIHSPWWVSGVAYGPNGEERHTICAAVRAKSETAAKKYIRDCHDAPKPRDLDWRFIEERGEEWEPFSDRFPRGKWMKWPPDGQMRTK